MSDSIITLTDGLITLHKYLLKRSLEQKLSEYSELWFCAYSNEIPEVNLGIGDWKKDFEATDYRGTLRRMKRDRII